MLSVSGVGKVLTHEAKNPNPIRLSTDVGGEGGVLKWGQTNGLHKGLKVVLRSNCASAPHYPYPSAAFLFVSRLGWGQHFPRKFYNRSDF